MSYSDYYISNGEVSLHYSMVNKISTAFNTMYYKETTTTSTSEAVYNGTTGVMTIYMQGMCAQTTS
jgi:hypothetical protein